MICQLTCLRLRHRSRASRGYTERRHFEVLTNATFGLRAVLAVGPVSVTNFIINILKP